MTFDISSRLGSLQAEQYRSMTSDKVKKQAEEIAALKSAVQACIAEVDGAAEVRPSPSFNPTEIVAAIRPSLTDAMKTDVLALLQNVQADVEKMVKEQMEQVNGTLVDNLTPTIRSVEMISAWVDKTRPPLNGFHGGTGNSHATSASSSRAPQQVERPPIPQTPR